MPLSKKLSTDIALTSPINKSQKAGEVLEDVRKLHLEKGKQIANLAERSELLSKEGKFIDNALEQDYQKYLARKSKESKSARDRLSWKEERDYWLYDSPMARGNEFNKKGEKIYDFNEIHLENGKRLDSYIPPTMDKKGMIISRKATDLENIELSTFESYLKEMKSKYSSGTTIRSNKYFQLDGKKLQGNLYLEIPESNKNFNEIEKYKKIAKKYDIEIIFLKE